MITIMDVALARLGRSASDDAPLNGDDFEQVGLEMLGGCYRCEASIAAYNAYPDKNGFWACKDCLGSGYISVVEFELDVVIGPVRDLADELVKACTDPDFKEHNLEVIKERRVLLQEALDAFDVKLKEMTK